MTFSWQDIAAIVVIMLAAIYLVMRIFRIGPWKRKPLCDCCESDTVEQPEKNLVKIKLPEQCNSEPIQPEQRHPERSKGSSSS